MKLKEYKSSRKDRPLSKGPHWPRDAAKEEVSRFIEYHPPGRVSKNLRKMLLEFLMADGSIEAVYLPELLFDLEGLFDLLDVFQEEGDGKIDVATKQKR